MGQIYGSGIRNLIWLGPSDGYAEEAIMAMETVLEDMRTTTKGFVNTFDIFFDEDNNNALASSSPFHLSSEQGALETIFSCLWFQRLWVVQEAALARENLVHYGHHEFALISLLRAGKWLVYKNGASGTFVQGILNSVFLWGYLEGLYSTDKVLASRKRHKLAFRVLIIQLRRFQATDARDHVYGVLGIWQQRCGRASLSEFLKPDYNKAVEDVWQDATRFALSEA
jgi:hypothetical protein